jgi:hypothetical protein
MVSEQKKIEGHKKKDEIISLLSFEVPKRWPYANCC